MKQRTFKAKTLAEAVAQVKQTLGDDAIIVSVRQVLLEPAWKIWQTPGVEVLAVKRGDARDEALLAQLQALTQKSSAKTATPPAKTPVPHPSPAVAPKTTSETNLPEKGEQESQLSLPKKTPKTESRSLNLQAFQAALRRANVEKAAPLADGEQQSPPEEQSQPQQPKQEIEVLLSNPEVLKKIKESQKSAEQKSAPPQSQAETLSSRPPEGDQQIIHKENKGIQEKDNNETAAYADLDLTPPKPKLALQELKEALLGESKPSTKPAIAKPLEELAENLRRQSQSTIPTLSGLTPEQSQAASQTGSEATASVAQVAPKPQRKPRWHYRPSPEAQRELLGPPKETIALPKKLAEVKNLLLNQGVDSSVVEKAINICTESLSPQSLNRDEILQDVIKKQLEAKIHVFSEAALKAHHHIVTIGPSGAGKTSFNGKLAAHIKLRRGEKVIWVSADTVRTGAIAEARVFTDLLDIPLILIYEPEELSQVIESTDPDTIVLIDTAACNPYREESLVELGSLLEVLHKKITYMALPATMKELDITQTLAAYTLFHIDGFVITKMDETCQYGAIFNAVWRSKLPIAYFTHGIDLLDGLSIADPSILSKALFGEPFLKGY